MITSIYYNKPLIPPLPDRFDGAFHTGQGRLLVTIEEQLADLVLKRAAAAAAVDNAAARVAEDEAAVAKLCLALQTVADLGLPLTPRYAGEEAKVAVVEPAPVVIPDVEAEQSPEDVEVRTVDRPLATEKAESKQRAEVKGRRVVFGSEMRDKCSRAEITAILCRWRNFTKSGPGEPTTKDSFTSEHLWDHFGFANLAKYPLPPKKDLAVRRAAFEQCVYIALQKPSKRLVDLAEKAKLEKREPLQVGHGGFHPEHAGQFVITKNKETRVHTYSYPKVNPPAYKAIE